MEKKVWIMEQGVMLEGRYQYVRGEKACAVITHPHPSYGGNMDNPVVLQMVKSFNKKGYSTLRFNFRGVGASTGSHGGGEAEMADVRAAIGFIDHHRLCLAGYSFGSRVNAGFMASDFGRGISDHIMVSPPVAFMSFEGVARPHNTGLVITGALDEIAPPDEVQEQMDAWNNPGRFEIIPGADHFFSGALHLLANTLEAYL